SPPRAYQSAEDPTTPPAMFFTPREVSTYENTSAMLSVRAPAPTAAAYLTVLVPRDAELRFGDTLMTERGPARQFVTPPWVMGQDYSYPLRARWSEGNRDVTEIRNVRIRAGDRLSVDFAAPASLSEPPALRTAPRP